MRIGRLSLLGATLVALVAPGTAAAHVTVTPHRLTPGAEALLVFSAPDERRSVSVVGLSVTLPPGFVVGSVETKSGWPADARIRTVVWRGGRIPPGQFALFALRAVASDRDGAFTVTATERFADGRASTFHPRLAVGPPAPSPAGPGHDAGARTLGRFALGGALAAILLATAVGFLALRNWLYLPDPDGDAGARAVPRADTSARRPSERG
jgi:hypothetical protein